MENIWNKLVKIKDLHYDESVKKEAYILLSQLNTASGSVIVKKEAISFINWINFID